jgi:NADH-quinone oxidoreductase subunit J
MDSAIGLTYFWLCAAMAVVGALATVANKNPIRGAMGLLLLILSVAGLFFALHAQFLAVIQLIVYAGAIVVLFLFVIMLLGPSAVAPRDSRGVITRSIGGLVFGGAALGGLSLVVRGGHAVTLANAPEQFGSVDSFGRVLFSEALVPFELSSALLMVAVVGAVAVARGKQERRPTTQPAMAASAEGEETAGGQS